jgi:hypothetical protein
MYENFEIPLLDDEYVTDDLHPVIFEIAQIKNQISTQ